jgi:ParB/RepB/Spo0J family partition protein
MKKSRMRETSAAPTRETGKEECRRPAPIISEESANEGPEILEAFAIEMIRCDEIGPSRFQRRRVFRGIEELAADIKSQGLLEPVMVRPNAERGMANAECETPEELYCPYELVFGERRLRACRLLGYQAIPAQVRLMTDDESAVALAMENWDREDPTLLEQAESVQLLLDRGWTLEMVAEKTGRPVKTCARLASLTRLSAAWKVMVEDPREGVSDWSLAHLQLIARLPEEVQEAVREQFIVRIGRDTLRRNEVGSTSVSELRCQLGDVSHHVGSARWGEDDDGLVPEAGSCANCGKRADRQPGLFDDDEFERVKRGSAQAQCLDASCWKRKTAAWVTRREAELRAKHPDLVIAAENYGRAAGRPNAVNRWALNECKKSEPGARPVLVVDGPSAGNMIWIRKDGSDGLDRSGGSGTGARPAGPKPLKARRADYDRRRVAWVMQKMIERFDDIHRGKESFPRHLEASDVLSFVCTYGTSWRASFLGQKSQIAVKGDCQHTIDLFCSACGVVSGLLRLAIQNKSEVKKEIIAGLCETLALDLEGLGKEAESAIRYPKSWAGLNEDGTAKKGKAAVKNDGIKAGPDGKGIPWRAYLNGKTQRLFVAQGLGAEWGTFYMSAKGGKHRVVSKHLPMTSDRAAAQEALDAWAQKCEFTQCCRNCGCTEAAACEGGCSWAEMDGGLCSKCADAETAGTDGATVGDAVKRGRGHGWGAKKIGSE